MPLPHSTNPIERNATAETGPVAASRAHIHS